MYAQIGRTIPSVYYPFANRRDDHRDSLIDIVFKSLLALVFSNEIRRRASKNIFEPENRRANYYVFGIHELLTPHVLTRIRRRCYVSRTKTSRYRPRIRERYGDEKRRLDEFKEKIRTRKIIGRTCATEEAYRRGFVKFTAIVVFETPYVER